MTKRRIDELIQSDHLARINRDEFWLQLTTYCQKAQLQTHSTRFTYTPTQQEIDAESLRDYVRQLGFVDVGRDEEIEAVTDYLSTKAAIVEYIERGVINDTSLDEYASDLEKHWKLTKRGLRADADSKDDLHFGKRLLNRCLIVHLPLQGAPTPSSFTPGCFHELADKREVGWHPHYLLLLEEL